MMVDWLLSYDVVTRFEGYHAKGCGRGGFDSPGSPDVDTCKAQIGNVRARFSLWQFMFCLAFMVGQTLAVPEDQGTYQDFGEWVIGVVLYAMFQFGATAAGLVNLLVSVVSWGINAFCIMVQWHFVQVLYGFLVAHWHVIVLIMIQYYISLLNVQLSDASERRLSQMEQCSSAREVRFEREFEKLSSTMLKFSQDVELRLKSAEENTLVRQFRAIADEARHTHFLQEHVAEAALDSSPLHASQDRNDACAFFYENGELRGTMFKVMQARNGAAVLVTAGHVTPQVGAALEYVLPGGVKKVFEIEMYFVSWVLDLCIMITTNNCCKDIRMLKAEKHEPDVKVKIFTPIYPPGDYLWAVGKIATRSPLGGSHTASTHPGSSGGPVLVDGSFSFVGMHYAGRVTSAGAVNTFVAAEVIMVLVNSIMCSGEEEILDTEGAEASAQNYVARFISWARDTYERTWLVIIPNTKGHSKLLEDLAIKDPIMVQVRVAEPGTKLFFVPDPDRPYEFGFLEYRNRLMQYFARTFGNIVKLKKFEIERIQNLDKKIIEHELIFDLKAVEKVLKDPETRRTLINVSKVLNVEFQEYWNDPVGWLEAHDRWAEVVEHVPGATGPTSHKKYGRSMLKGVSKETQFLIQQTQAEASDATAEEVSELLNLQRPSGLIRVNNSIYQLVAEEAVLWNDAISKYFRRECYPRAIEKAPFNSNVFKGMKSVEWDYWTSVLMKKYSYPPFDLGAILDSFASHSLTYRSLLPQRTTISDSWEVDSEIAIKLARLTPVGADRVYLKEPDWIDKFMIRVSDYLQIKGPRGFYSMVGSRSPGLHKGTKASVVGLEKAKDGGFTVHPVRFAAFLADLRAWLLLFVDKKASVDIVPFIKDEPHKIHKIKAKMHRIIANVDIFLAVVSMVSFASLQQFDVEHWRDLPWVIGADLDHAQFGEHAVTRVGTDPQSTDNSGYDWTQNEADVKFFRLYVREIYGADSLQEFVVTAIFAADPDIPVLFWLPGGQVLRQLFIGYLKSGWFMTAHFNSVLMTAYEMAWLKHVSPASIIVVPKDMMVWGDDNTKKCIDDPEGRVKFWTEAGKVLKVEGDLNAKEFCSRKLIKLTNFDTYIFQNINFDKSAVQLLTGSRANSVAAYTSMCYNFCLADADTLRKLIAVGNLISFDPAARVEMCRKFIKKRIQEDPEPTLPLESVGE